MTCSASLANPLACIMFQKIQLTVQRFVTKLWKITNKQRLGAVSHTQIMDIANQECQAKALVTRMKTRIKFQSRRTRKDNSLKITITVQI